MAALFSSVDVRSGDASGHPGKPMGIFHRNFSRRIVGLRQYLCDDVLFQWSASVRAVGTHRPVRKAGFSYRGACVVFQSRGGDRVRVGIFPDAGKECERCMEVCGYIRAHNRVFCAGYGFVSATLPWPFSSDDSPTPTIEINLGFRLLRLAAVLHCNPGLKNRAQEKTGSLRSG